MTCRDRQRARRTAHAAVEQIGTFSLERPRIHSPGQPSFPQRQQPPRAPLDVGVCLIFQLQVHEVVRQAEGLCSKSAAVQDVIPGLLCDKLIRFDEGVRNVCSLLLAINNKFDEVPIAIEYMFVAPATSIKPSWPAIMHALSYFRHICFVSITPAC